MAIFNSSDIEHKSDKPDSSTTIITVGSSIKGEMNLSCNLYVDGEFEGVINSKNEVNVGKHGLIKGDLIAKRLVVQGYLEGTINADKVEIKSNGRVNGTIESTELIIESKGIFEGNSVVKGVKPAPTTKTISNQSKPSPTNS